MSPADLQAKTDLRTKSGIAALALLRKGAFTHIDLFAGPGGICTGFKAAGIQTIAAVEYVESCAETYSANHPAVEVVVEDIRKVSNAKIKSLLDKNGLSSIDVVSAGFPCETFSTAGSKSRVYNDHRNFLYKEAIRIADAADAKLLMLENVQAFISKRVDRNSPLKVFDLLINDLDAAGFKYHDFAILNASDYGVPQNRQRFILVASKSIPIKKEMFNGGKLSKKISVKEALSDLPLIGPETESKKYASSPKNEYQKLLRNRFAWKAGKSNSPIGLSYHIAPKHRLGTIKRLAMIEQGEGLKDLFGKLSKKQIEKLQKEKVLPKKWYIQRNQRLVPAKQSMTVTSHCLDEIVHPYLDRGPSVREVARLQSFPDWYDFRGGPLICPHMYKTQDKYEQIGDAVPPLLAKHLGKSLIKILEQYA